jgi:hypothetical protein
MSMKRSDSPRRPAILRAARKEGDRGLLRELWLFVRSTRKWWLVPVLIALLILGAAAVLSGTVYAPFIYTLF